MNKDHFDIGTIQAFLDGELAHDRAAEVSSHVGICDDCALMLAQAEDESAIIFPALESEFNTLVPTHRLWNKINDSITIEKKNAPFWQKAWAFLAVAVASPSLTAAAALILLVGIVATVFLNRTPVSNDVAFVPTKAVQGIPVTATNTPSIADPGDKAFSDLRSIPAAERASYQPSRRNEYVQTDYRVPVNNSVDTGYLPGEESYVKTIETLSKNVSPTKDQTMSPSERVSYERDMAVVDDAITKTRAQIKKNPRNESAKQVLYSSYQNKIDLLSSVSQKEELMASIGTR